MAPPDPPLEEHAPPPAAQDAGAAFAGLPAILEIKRTVAGVEKRFECRRLHEDGAHLVVLFVAPAAMRVHGIALPAGTVTFGHFWRDRPYNVYHWLDPVTGSSLGAYVNLAAETRIDDDRLEWLDLIVDVLVVPGQTPRVLDEDEIPAGAPPDLMARIAAARAAVLDGMAPLLDELERFRSRLWPALRRHAVGAP
ncbi:MAG TPA: DUF402 domain-containing protein [Polyangia bacterium]